MGTVRKLVVVAAIAIAATSVQAADVTVAAVKTAGGKELSGAELTALLPGKTARRTSDRFDQSWVHDQGGKIRASSVEKTGYMHNRSGSGSWQVNDQGQYCLQIEWPRLSWNWCRYIYQVGDDYFGFDSKADNAASKIKFTLN